MDREELGERSITKLLWGYPDLTRKLHDEVRPVLLDAAREEERRKIEKEQRQDTTTEHGGSDSFHPSVSLAALADESGRLDETQSDVQRDSQSNICTPTWDGRPHLVASERTDPLKPASRNPNQWMDIYGEGEKKESQEDINRQSRKVQSEGHLEV